MIHLVKVKYRISEYMVDDDDRIVSKLFTVEADDTIEAENKFINTSMIYLTHMTLVIG